MLKAWTTADDNRIERKTRELGAGYFKFDELRAPARGTVTELVKSERASSRPCTA